MTSRAQARIAIGDHVINQGPNLLQPEEGPNKTPLVSAIEHEVHDGVTVGPRHRLRHHRYPFTPFTVDMGQYNGE